MGDGPGSCAQDSHSALFNAAEEGDIEALYVHLSTGRSNPVARETGYRGWTALHMAASEGRLEVVQALIAYGVNPDIRSGVLQRDGDWLSWDCGETPLMIASRRGHEAVVRALLAAGSDVQAEDAYGGTALHSSVLSDSCGIVTLLLERGASTEAISYYRYFDEDLGWHSALTPLHLVAKYGAVEAMRCLLEHGAQVDSHYTCFRTPLFHAAAKGRVEAVGLLLNHHANPNYRELTYAGHYMRDWCPLHYATRNGHIQVVELLLKSGAKPNPTDSTTGETPLRIARDQVRYFGSTVHKEIVDILRRATDEVR